LRLVSVDDDVSTVRFGDDAWVLFRAETETKATTGDRCRADDLTIVAEQALWADELREKLRALARAHLDGLRIAAAQNERDATILALRPEP
jgi:hypothetical protein